MIVHRRPRRNEQPSLRTHVPHFCSYVFPSSRLLHRSRPDTRTIWVVTNKPEIHQRSRCIQSWRGSPSRRQTFFGALFGDFKACYQCAQRALHLPPASGLVTTR